jgi:hypothetical protein
MPGPRNSGHIRTDGDVLENGPAVRAHVRLQRTKGLTTLAPSAVLFVTSTMSRPWA